MTDEVGPDPDGLDGDIRNALAQALKEKRTKVTDRRMLLLYLLIVIALVCMGVMFQRSEEARHQFERRSIVNCYEGKRNAQGINALINQLIQATAGSTLLTPAEREHRITLYSEAVQSIPDCPPLPRGLHVPPPTTPTSLPSTIPTRKTRESK